MAEEEKKVPYSDIVYRVPGPHAAHNGKNYEYVHVTSKEDHAQKLKDGWSDSLVEAVEGKEAVTVSAKASAPQGDAEPPTRDEAKAKADELGIEYPGNIPTAKLIDLITAKLKDK